MNCEEAKISLHDFVDEELDGFMKRDVEAHLRKCDSCLNEYKKIRIFFDKLKDIPYLVEPPEELVNTFSSHLLKRSLSEEMPNEAHKSVDVKKLKKEQTRQEKQLHSPRGALRKSFISKTLIVSRNSQFPTFPRIKWSRLLLILLPLILIAAGYFIFDYQKNNSPWKVITLEGNITINGLIDNSGIIHQGQSLLTDNSSRAAIRIPKVGNVEVGENSLLVLTKAKDGNNRIMLRSGSINVTNLSNMPEFSIELKDCIVNDRGGEFNISIYNNKNAVVNVKYGFVEIKKNEKIIYLNEDHICEIRYGFNIGTPYRQDAAEALKAEVMNFDFSNGGDNSVNKIMELATEKDMLTLLALIPNSSQLQRQILFQAIANKFPPPESVTKRGIINGDLHMLYLWWNEIVWQL